MSEDQSGKGRKTEYHIGAISGGTQQFGDHNTITNMTNQAEAGSQPAQEKAGSANTKIKILFLAASPRDSKPLRLGEEMREIEEALLKTRFRDRFELHQKWAVRVGDLQGALLQHQPHIVHFSGHGIVPKGAATNGIVLEDNRGNGQPVPIEAVAKMFEILKDNIRCVVLNACYMTAQAEALAAHIDCVAGMTRAISDQDAIRFAGAFYQALGYGRSIKTAFDSGCLEIGLAGSKGMDTPQLLAPNCDPAQVVF